MEKKCAKMHENVAKMCVQSQREKKRKIRTIRKKIPQKSMQKGTRFTSSKWNYEENVSFRGKKIQKYSKKPKKLIAKIVKKCERLRKSQKKMRKNAKMRENYFWKILEILAHF